VTVPRTILVPTDFSEHAEAALAYAAGLAGPLDATIHLLHVIALTATGMPELGVVYSSMDVEAATLAAQRKLDELAARYRDRVALGPTRVEIGDARLAIDQVAELLGADLIVMGTHGRSGLRRMLMGSVAESVVRTAPCPVLSVRRAKS
jgi:nucleotide-binding universal stress UspA family protein